MISNPDKKSRRTSAAFYGVLAFATIATTVFHESAHFGMGLALGHEMAMSFNQTHAVSAASVSARDAMLIAAAGPAVTISQAAIAFVLIRGRAQMMAYSFLFVAWFMRFAAAIVSLSHPNDEARLSIDLLGGMWWLPAAVVLGLLVLVWSASHRLKLSWKTNLMCYLICSAMTAAIVFGDRFLTA